jgi:hypothetical protein
MINSPTLPCHRLTAAPSRLSRLPHLLRLLPRSSRQPTPARSSSPDRFPPGRCVATQPGPSLVGRRRSRSSDQHATRVHVLRANLRYPRVEYSRISSGLPIAESSVVHPLPPSESFCYGYQPATWKGMPPSRERMRVPTWGTGAVADAFLYQDLPESRVNHRGDAVDACRENSPECLIRGGAMSSVATPSGHEGDRRAEPARSACLKNDWKPCGPVRSVQSPCVALEVPAGRHWSRVWLPNEERLVDGLSLPGCGSKEVPARTNRSRSALHGFPNKGVDPHKAVPQPW